MAWEAVSTAARRAIRRTLYTFAGEYSYSNVDAPLRSATSISYELPIGKGKELWNPSSRAVDLIVGGWVINTVSVFQSGFPLQVFQNNANAQYGYGVSALI